MAKQAKVGHSNKTTTTKKIDLNEPISKSKRQGSRSKRLGSGKTTQKSPAQNQRFFDEIKYDGQSQLATGTKTISMSNGDHLEEPRELFKIIVIGRPSAVEEYGVQAQLTNANWSPLDTEEPTEIAPKATTRRKSRTPQNASSKRTGRRLNIQSPEMEIDWETITLIKIQPISPITTTSFSLWPTITIGGVQYLLSVRMRVRADQYHIYDTETDFDNDKNFVHGIVSDGSGIPKIEDFKIPNGNKYINRSSVTAEGPDPADYRYYGNMGWLEQKPIS